MSYDISLVGENGKPIDTGVLRQEGGTYQVGGHTLAELNVTYNYSKHFPFRQLDQVSAKNSLPLLSSVLSSLDSKDVDDDYWKATEGNVRKAVQILYDFAKYAVDNNIVTFFVVR